MISTKEKVKKKTTFLYLFSPGTLTLEMYLKGSWEVGHMVVLCALHFFLFNNLVFMIF